MTFEEAKNIFLNKGYIEVPGGTYYDADKWRNAIVVISKWLEQQPCEDCISRQAVLSYISNDLGFGDEENGYDLERKIAQEEIYNFVKKILPSVTPKEKTGKWIDRSGGDPTDSNVSCSLCNKWFHQSSNYCPNCGAKMEVNK